MRKQDNLDKCGVQLTWTNCCTDFLMSWEHWNKRQTNWNCEWKTVDKGTGSAVSATIVWMDIMSRKLKPHYCDHNCGGYSRLLWTPTQAVWVEIWLWSMNPRIDYPPLSLWPRRIQLWDHLGENTILHPSQFLSTNNSTHIEIPIPRVPPEL